MYVLKMLPIADFDYNLPEDLIAQTPVEPRDHSRLFVLNRATEAHAHHAFYEIEHFLKPGDLLVANDSRVLPARLHGTKASGGRTEALLLRQTAPLAWEALLKGKVRVGTRIQFGQPDHSTHHIWATVTELLPGGTRILQFDTALDEQLQQLGEMPLPPYITTPLADPGRYQTVYSAQVGSAAAPTAGLHWTPELIERVKAKGVEWASVTLHVGLDTFRPVQHDDALAHAMHSEWYMLPEATAAAIKRTRERGGRVIAVGTTTVRVLETVGQQLHGQVAAWSGWTNIYIYPPYTFKLVDGLITNFHLPRSTLLLLVSAFTSRETLLHAYATAVAARYRFFSFGDAMLIL